MYYVNHEQIDQRLRLIPELVEAAIRLREEWNAAASDGTEAPDKPDLLQDLAQERLLHLAVELVTDVGSLLIDGFLMRDASSYEDIVEIIRVEGVLPAELVDPLIELVRLRRPLVQEYMKWERGELHPLTVRLPELLPVFERSVAEFIAKELG